MQRVSEQQKPITVCTPLYHEHGLVLSQWSWTPLGHDPTVTQDPSPHGHCTIPTHYNTHGSTPHCYKGENMHSEPLTSQNNSSRTTASDNTNPRDENTLGDTQPQRQAAYYAAPCQYSINPQGSRASQPLIMQFKHDTNPQAELGMLDHACFFFSFTSCTV